MELDPLDKVMLARLMPFKGFKSQQSTVSPLNDIKPSWKYMASVLFPANHSLAGWDTLGQSRNVLVLNLGTLLYTG